MITETLLGFACLIANGDSNADPVVVQAQKVMGTLSNAELTELQSLVQSGACLPQVFERLIEQTRQKVDNGTIPELQAHTGPSESCF